MARSRIRFEARSDLNRVSVELGHGYVLVNRGDGYRASCQCGWETEPIRYEAAREQGIAHQRAPGRNGSQHG